MRVLWAARQAPQKTPVVRCRCCMCRCMLSGRTACLPCGHTQHSGAAAAVQQQPPWPPPLQPVQWRWQHQRCQQQRGGRGRSRSRCWRQGRVRQLARRQRQQAKRRAWQQWTSTQGQRPCLLLPRAEGRHKGQVLALGVTCANGARAHGSGPNSVVSTGLALSLCRRGQ